MTLESTLYYLTHHSETIIQWLFLTILLLASILIGRGLFGKKPVEAASGAGAGTGTTPEIHTFLQKILDQTAKLESVSLEKMSAGSLGQVDAQVQALKKDLQSREEELAKLKAAGNAAPSADAEKLGSRIKELESKLSEYEILEDDIADLSLYKEENQRLKAELEKVRGGGTPTAQRSDTSGPAAPAASAVGEDIVAEFAEAVGQDTAPDTGASLGLEATGNPMDDFATALKLERKMQGSEPEPPTPAPPEPPSPPTPPPVQAAAPAAPRSPAPASKFAAPPVAAAPDPTAEGDDLFAEFSAPPPGSEVDAATPAEDHSLDTDKMMAEMAALVSMEPTKGTALEDSIDTEKMALEATNLHKS